MKRIINEWKYLDGEDKAFFGYGGLMLLGAVFLFWLVSTVRPPVVDHHPTDYQTYHEAKYELSKSYNSYAQRIYNEKYGK